MSGTKQIAVYPPEEVARRLGGISVALLVSILKAHGYEYTQLTPGAKPWGRGRQVWGMTDEQIADLIAGQTRQHPKPENPADRSAARPIASPGLRAMGWDGVERASRPIVPKPTRRKKA